MLAAADVSPLSINDSSLASTQIGKSYKSTDLCTKRLYFGERYASGPTVLTLIPVVNPAEGLTAPKRCPVVPADSPRSWASRDRLDRTLPHPAERLAAKFAMNSGSIPMPEVSLKWVWSRWCNANAV